jgi:hypothetical protein
MFRCGICDAVQPPGTVETPVVLETRPKEYKFRAKANWVPSKDTFRDDPGGKGWEIAKEVKAGPCCAPKAAPVAEVT